MPESFLIKQILAQVFSCKFCEVFKNNVFTKQLWTSTSSEEMKEERVAKRTVR